MKKLTKVLIVILVLVLGGEIYFRIAFKEVLKTRKLPQIYQPDSLLDYKFIPNANSVISLPGIKERKVHINSKGFHCPEFDIDKKPGTYRIIIVGASTSGGIYMDGETDYATRLQTLFNASHKKVEVLNCAIDGDDRQRANMDLIKSQLVQYHPDLILLEFNLPVTSSYERKMGYKDYVIAFRSDSSRIESMKKIDDMENHWFLRGLFDMSYIVRALRLPYLRNGSNAKLKERIVLYWKKKEELKDAEAQKIKVRYSVAGSFKLLKETRDSVWKHHSKLLLIGSFGKKFDEKDVIDVELMDSLKKMGLETFYAGLEFKDIHVSKPDGHLNEKGHDLIAQALYARLKNVVK